LFYQFKIASFGSGLKYLNYFLNHFIFTASNLKIANRLTKTTTKQILYKIKAINFPIFLF